MPVCCIQAQRLRMFTERGDDHNDKIRLEWNDQSVRFLESRMTVSKVTVRKS